VPKKSEFPADSNDPISPKFRAGKIYAILEIRSQKIPFNGKEISGSSGGKGWGRGSAIPKFATGRCPWATHSK